MNILQKNQKSEVRFKKGDFILYEPSEIQLVELYKMLENQDIKIEGDKVVGETNIGFLRYIMRELTSIGNVVDEYTDVELDLLTENGNRDLALLMREIVVMTNELVEDLLYKQSQEVDLVVKMLDILGKSDREQEIETKFNKLMKKNKIDTTFEEFLANKEDPEFLKSKTVKKSNKKNK